jgi:hypothetical protein
MGGDTFVRNVGFYKPYTAPHLRRRHSSLRLLDTFLKGLFCLSAINIPIRTAFAFHFSPRSYLTAVNIKRKVTICYAKPIVSI